MKFDERETCWFFDRKCLFPIDEETLRVALEDEDPADVTCAIPYEYTGTCQNCILAEIARALNPSLKMGSPKESSEG